MKIIGSHIVLNIRQIVNSFLVIVLFFSLSHSFIIPIFDLPVLDAIECSENAEETEKESEKEKETFNDEFLKVDFFTKYDDSRNKSVADGPSDFHSNFYIDIFTPPPELI